MIEPCFSSITSSSNSSLLPLMLDLLPLEDLENIVATIFSIRESDVFRLHFDQKIKPAASFIPS
jgi:hypothetical protein